MPNEAQHLLNKEYLDRLEQKLSKENSKKRKGMKISGKSVFKLQNLIKKKSNDVKK